MSDIAKRLRAGCTDWNGDQMDGEAAPMDCLTAGDVREAAAEIDRLRAQVAEMQSQGYDLALLVMRLARRMRHAREGRGHRAGDDALTHAATDYLHRKGLISPLRTAADAAAIDRARKSGDGGAGSMKDPALLAEAKALVREGVELMTVWTPQGWKAPRGFPRKELLCVPTTGGKTWRVNAARLVRFLEGSP